MADERTSVLAHFVTDQGAVVTVVSVVKDVRHRGYRSACPACTDKTSGTATESGLSQVRSWANEHALTCQAELAA
ncbi:hypothetical protein [Streptomyces sp. NPDC006638]|uniref:hypothetical protein n=1 Tax=Streptomyces sp. NPDC006638 TaxID=3157183 RepID=UPI0033A57EF6